MEAIVSVPDTSAKANTFLDKLTANLANQMIIHSEKLGHFLTRT